MQQMADALKGRMPGYGQRKGRKGETLYTEKGNDGVAYQELRVALQPGGSLEYEDLAGADIVKKTGVGEFKINAPAIYGVVAKKDNELKKQLQIAQKAKAEADIIRIKTERASLLRLAKITKRVNERGGLGQTNFFADELNKIATAKDADYLTDDDGGLPYSERSRLIEQRKADAIEKATRRFIDKMFPVGRDGIRRDNKGRKISETDARRQADEILSDHIELRRR